MSAKPLNPYTADRSHTAEAVWWWALINQAEWLTAQSGFGLANTWQWINKGNYHKARLALDISLIEWNEHCDEHSHPDRRKTPWAQRQIFRCIEKTCDNMFVASDADDDARGMARECGWSVGSDDIGDESVCPIHRVAWGRC